MKQEFKEGDKVHYDPGHKKPENGMIKSVGTHTAFVVYNCDGDWEQPNTPDAEPI